MQIKTIYGFENELNKIKTEQGVQAMWKRAEELMQEYTTRYNGMRSIGADMYAGEFYRRREGLKAFVADIVVADAGINY